MVRERQNGRRRPLLVPLLPCVQRETLREGIRSRDSRGSIGNHFTGQKDASAPLCLGFRFRLFVQHTTSFLCAGRVERRLILFDLANNPLFVHDEGAATCKATGFHQDTVFFGYFVRKVTEEGEGYTDFVSKLLQRGGAIDADAENLGICSLEFGDISLIRL